MGDPLYRPALYKIVGSLPSSEHQVTRAVFNEQTRYNILGLQYNTTIYFGIISVIIGHAFIRLV